MKKLLLMLAVLLISVQAMAQEVAVKAAEAADIPGIIGFIRQGFADRNWGMLVGAALMLLVALARPLMERWKQMDGIKPMLPWITVAVAVLFSVGSALVAGTDWLAAIVEAIQTGGVSVLFWEMIAKKLPWLPGQKKRMELKKARTASISLATMEEARTTSNGG